MIMNPRVIPAYRCLLDATGSKERYLLLGTGKNNEGCVLLLPDKFGRMGMHRRFMTPLPCGGMPEYLREVSNTKDRPWCTPYATVLGVPATCGIANLQQPLGTPWPLIVARLGSNATQSFYANPTLVTTDHSPQKITAKTWEYLAYHIKYSPHLFDFVEGELEALTKLFKILHLAKADKRRVQLRRNGKMA